jgi:hypothetical protein
MRRRLIALRLIALRLMSLGLKPLGLEPLKVEPLRLVPLGLIGLGLVRLGLIGRELVTGEGGLRVVVVRSDRLDPVAPAGPAAEGREILAGDLRRIVVHRLGSSLWVLMVVCMRAGFVHLFERKPNIEFSIPSAPE